MGRRSFLVCDHCGNEQEVPAPEGVTLNGWMNTHLSFYGGGDPPDKHLDLCPDCAPAVRKAVDPRGLLKVGQPGVSSPARPSSEQP